jgi:hypothetical protein
MPSAEQLPNDIRRLASISGTSLTAVSWREDTERLKVALDTLVKT